MGIDTEWTRNCFFPRIQYSLLRPKKTYPDIWKGLLLSGALNKEHSPFIVEYDRAGTYHVYVLVVVKIISFRYGILL